MYKCYGWINSGANISTNSVKPGGNAPVGYDYTPNTIQLDQAVVYIERLPDTVQNDHFDWGFRLSGIYGVDYRYTTAYGFMKQSIAQPKSRQRLRHADDVRGSVFSCCVWPQRPHRTIRFHTRT